MEKVSVNKSIKGMALTTAAVAAAVLPFMHTNAASADDSAKGWRSKTVDEVRTTVKDDVYMLCNLVTRCQRLQQRRIAVWTILRSKMTLRMPT